MDCETSSIHNGWMFSDAWQFLKDHFIVSQSIETKVIYTVIALLLFGFVKWLFLLIVLRNRDVKVQYRIRKIAGYVVWSIAFLVVGRIWFAGIEALSTYLGLLSAGLAIAMQSPLVNLAGWAFILWRQPFKVGDRVEIGSSRGDVIDQRIFMFSLLEIGNWVDADQSTGRVIHVPNGKVFSEVLANYGQGFHYIWNEIPVLVTFESNWKLAKELLSDIANSHGGKIDKEAQQKLKEAAKKFMIFYNNLTPIVYTSVKDCGVMLTIRYLTDPRQRRSTEQRIWENILETFAKHDDIDFAYPTQRFYSNASEGKLGTRPEALYPEDDVQTGI